MLPLAQALDLLTKNTGLFAGIVIVVLGVALGIGDLKRFSLTRIRAIASVCFTQAIRRRVLWVTVLVIGGILVVSQFQKSLDAQDQVRQITTYCLFATGMLVTMLIIILACTNIPREVETRVIYTVATKPVTRLEIVLGKVLGFVYVSFWVLVIMGAFTLAYLYWLDASNRKAIAAQIAGGHVPDASRHTLQYYKDHGTLHARVFERPGSLSVLAHRPKDDDDQWAAGHGGGAEVEIVVPFEVDRTKIPPPRQAAPGSVGPIGPGLTDASSYPGGLLVKANFRARRVRDVAVAPVTRPTTAPSNGFIDTRQPPQVAVELRSGANETIVFTKDIVGGAAGLPEGGGTFTARVPAEHVERWLVGPVPARVIVMFVPGNDQHEMAIDPASIQLVALDGSVAFKPAMPPMYTGTIGQYGQKLRGAKGGSGRVAVYRFRSVELPAGLSSHPFELRAGIEPNRNDDDGDDLELNELRLTFHNRKTNHEERVTIFPENNRPAYFNVPAAAVDGGDFDVILDLHSSAWLGLNLTSANASLRMVKGSQSFAFNVIKSLLILWLLSLLVTIISIFCSTFLSWPIAVVLTLLILTGHWGAGQLGDIAKPGIGRQIANDMFRKANPSTATAVSETVDALVQVLNLVAGFLPDISRFAALEHVDRGIAIPAAAIWDSLRVTFGYGVPLLVLAWFLLKQKEVAP